MIDRIRTELNEALEREHADNDMFFECLEVSVKNKKVSGYRIYSKTHSARKSSFEDLPELIRNFAIRICERYPSMKFFDYSRRDEGLYSVSFNTDGGPELPPYGSPSPHPEISSYPMQVGYLIKDTGGEASVLETKSYFRVPKNFRSYGDYLPQELITKSEAFDYVPLLVGVNTPSDGGAPETKLYMIYGKRYSNVTARMIAEEFTSGLIDTDFAPFIDLCFAKDLWLTGFGYSKDGGDGQPLLRLYFFKEK